jgi:hypothetical protein
MENVRILIGFYRVTLYNCQGSLPALTYGRDMNKIDAVIKHYIIIRQGMIKVSFCAFQIW